MPNYITSYSTKKKPRYRKNTGSQLPNGRRRQQHKRGAQYLRRSISKGNRSYSLRGGGRHKDPRRTYALVIVGCAFLLFLASIIWYANRSVDITLNGETASVRIHSTIEGIIESQELDLKPGNLLAVDDSVLEKGAGTACTVTLNDKKIENSQLGTVEVTGGEELTIADGEDLYEEHDIQATTIEPTLTVSGSGPVGYVKTWGIPGRSEIWTGKTTGKTQDRGVVQETVNCEVVRTSVSPSGKKKLIALTFDEGPSPRTEELLSILKEKGAQATFFVSGDKVSSNVAAVKAIVDSGNELGTNAYSDTDLTALSGEDLRSQLTSSFDAVKQATGASVSLLRAPYGQFSDENWAQAMDLVSAVISWDVDSGDWLLNGAQSVVDNVTGSAGNGSIVLLTDNDATADQTVEALPAIIDALQAEGYEFVTLSDLVASDEKLAEAITLSKNTMPKDAVLPQLSKEDESGSSSE